jgi:DtxR family transcriptional regulator, Mn-dependent transcriptional regulator
MMTLTEENYIKAIFHIAFKNDTLIEVGTNELATQLNVKPATANSMLKKLKEKKLITYEKYGKISLTKSGKEQAITMVRKHRLWETFLYEKLEFTWDEVHEVAEELEHINSDKLIQKLDKFLNYPKFDPHGDAIPNENGEFSKLAKKLLADMEVGTNCKMVAVKDNSTNFLQYVVSIGLAINNNIKIISRNDYDALTVIDVNGKEFSVSQKFAENIYVV